MFGFPLSLRHCEEAKPTKQSRVHGIGSGLLRCARNDASGVISKWGSWVLPRREKRPQLAIGLFRRLLGKIMPAGQRGSAPDVGSVILPYLGRLVVAADRARRAPQQQDRALDPAAGGDILRVHVEVDAEGRAIVLTHSMDRCRIAEAALVFGERF